MNLDEFTEQLENLVATESGGIHSFVEEAFRENKKLPVDALTSKVALWEVGGFTVAHIAARQSREAALQIIDMPDIRAERDGTGTTVIERAMVEHVEVAREVLNRPELREWNRAGSWEDSPNAPLAHLSVRAHPELGPDVLEDPQIYELKDPRGWTMAHTAALRSVEAARMIVEEKPELLRKAMPSGYTVAHAAAEGHEEIALELLEYPEICRLVDQNQHWSVAHEMAEHFEAALKIVETPELRSLVADNGYTPLHVAVETYARAAYKALHREEYWDKQEGEDMGVAQKGIWEHGAALGRELMEGEFPDEVARKFLRVLTEQQPADMVGTFFRDPRWLTQYDRDLLLVLLNHEEPAMRAIGVRASRYLSEHMEDCSWGPERSSGSPSGPAR